MWTMDLRKQKRCSKHIEVYMSFTLWEPVVFLIWMFMYYIVIQMQGLIMETQTWTNTWGYQQFARKTFCLTTPSSTVSIIPGNMNKLIQDKIVFSSVCTDSWAPRERFWQVGLIIFEESQQTWNYETENSEECLNKGWLGIQKV